MVITNDGPRVLTTDYWTSDHAARGLLYLSVNTGAVRLLVPPICAEAFAQQTASASRAAVQIAGAAYVTSGFVHVLWDDDSDSPYSVRIDVRQCDRVLPRSEAGRWVQLVAYTAGGTPTGVREIGCVPALIRAASDDIDGRAVPAPPPQSPPRDR